MKNNSIVSTSNETQIILCTEDSDLKIDDGSAFIAKSRTIFNFGATNNIIVNGDITIGENVVFNVVNDESSLIMSKIKIDNRRLDITLDKVSINYLPVEINAHSVNIIHSNFMESANVTLGAPNIQVENSVFDKSKLKASWMRAGGVLGFTSALVESNNFTGSGATAIELSGYENYTVINNTISGRINGIQLFHAGTGAANSQTVSNNAITNCSEAALVIYNTTGAVENNRIENNYCGVKLLNGSNVSMVGNSGAADIFDTQLIKDNTTHQVYATEFSFPWYIKFNAIIDDVNTVPLVQYDRPGQLDFVKANIADNFWGTGFNATTDLYVQNGIFKPLPLWSPLNPYYPSELDLLYKGASDAFAAENYSDAKIAFVSIVENYPESEYAEASMKELLRVESFAAKGFTSLQEFYRINPTIAANENLAKLGDFLANLCDVKMENWATAIDWYEAKIANSTTEQERIFAEIDLGHTYFLMENSDNKAAASITGSMLQHKYKDVKIYNNNRDFLITQLPGERVSESLKNDLRALESGALLSNYPNPFSESTQIWYKTERESQVELVIFDMTGKVVSHLGEGLKEQGMHKAEFVNNGLSAGIYFYSLVIDGVRTDSKKMNIMR